MKVRASILIAMLVLAGVACSSKKDTANDTPSTTPPPAAGNSVGVTGLSFTPQALTVTAGSTVTWNWAGSVPHNVVADDASFTSGAPANGDSFEHTFPAAGTFAYSCAVHKTSGMTGTITVA